MKERNKVIEGRNYGSIPHLSNSKLGEHDKYIHEGQDRIIRNGGRDKNDVVIVSLKLDGTNVGVIKQGGRLITLQRKGYGCASSPYRQHHEFDKWVHENYECFDRLLEEGERVAGEWMWQASGIQYTIHGSPFYAFDIFLVDGKREQWSQTVLRCADVGIECPPSIPFVKGEAVDLMPRKIGKKSLAQPCLYNDENGRTKRVKHEGYVYRVERKGEFDFMAKWVRPDFIPGKYLPGVRDNGIKEPVQNILL